MTYNDTPSLWVSTAAKERHSPITIHSGIATSSQGTVARFENQEKAIRCFREAGWNINGNIAQ